MSTTTTTTRDRGDRYGPTEWAQSRDTVYLLEELCHRRISCDERNGVWQINSMDYVALFVSRLVA